MATSRAEQIIDLDTPAGPARALLARPPGAADGGLLVLGHGAGGGPGGGVGAPDLVAVTAAATAAGWHVARVEQPWRVAGRRVAPAPARLDEAWVPVVAELRRRTARLRSARPHDLLVVGGRSAGARVACRTAALTGAGAVLCLAFPLHPPGRPERSRLEELRRPAGAGLPVLAVAGRRDAFGTADELAAQAPAGVQVVAVDGDHGLAAGAAAAADAVTSWLSALECGS